MSTPTQDTNPGPVEANPKSSRPAAAETVTKRKTAASKRKSAPATRKRAQNTQPASRAPSKQDRVVAMLRRPDGATVAAVTKATGWQKHSVHGFLAGVVRKKLGLNLISAEMDGKRVYRIVASKSGKAATKSGKRVATSSPVRKRPAA